MDLGSGERGDSGYTWVAVQKFFNRSPITLKFGGSKLERESQERERERERARARAEQVVIFTLVSCHSTLVSWHSILVSFCYFYL